MTLSPALSRALIIVVGISLSVGAAYAKRKDDVVIMKNGDRFTGEIKQLLHGELAFKAAYMSSAAEMNWADVARVESKDAFIISLVDGSRVSGYIATANNEGESQLLVRLDQERRTMAIPHGDVVELEQT